MAIDSAALPKADWYARQIGWAPVRFIVFRPDRAEAALLVETIHGIDGYEEAMQQVRDLLGDQTVIFTSDV